MSQWKNLGFLITQKKKDFGYLYHNEHSLGFFVVFAIFLFLLLVNLKRALEPLVNKTHFIILMFLPFFLNAKNVQIRESCLHEGK